MNNNFIHTRIKQKIDSLENWKNSQLTLLSGEIAIVDMGNGKFRMKVGDGVSTFNDLAYVSGGTAVNIDGDLAVDEFSVIHISKDEYEQKVAANDGSILSNVLYVVSSDIIDARGERIVNLGNPVDLSDAVTLGYADSRYLTEHQSLTGYYTKSETDQLSTVFRSGLATTASLTAYQPKGNYLTAHQSLTNYYTKQETNALSTAFRSGLASKAGISVSYDSATNKIELDADGNKTYVDCTSFIKDGMVSDASYDSASKKIILTFNTDAGKSPISVDVAALVDTYTAGTGLTADGNQFSIDENVVATKQHVSDTYETKSDHQSDVTALSAELSSKINIDDHDAEKLYLKHVSAQEYAQILKDGALSNCVYVVSSETVDACGESIKNVADPVDEQDAATKKYVDQAVGNVDLTQYYKTTETSSASQLTTAFNNKAAKATTLAGYGITDAKIQNTAIILGSTTLTVLTAHQSLTNYYTKAQVNAISSVLSTEIINQTMTTIRRWTDI